jgi:hypothetical protein
MEDSNVFWSTLNRYYSLKEEDDNKENPKCVICHRNKSSTFSIVTDKNRKLVASCNNKNPCSIEIIIPPFSLLTKELNIQTQQIESLQNKIIEIKNEFIFGYSTEQQTVETFQQLKTNLNETILKSEKLFQLLVDIKPNEAEINEYKRERDELIALYKSTIVEYKTNKSIMTLERAITIYKDIKITNDKIMKSSYIYNNVEEEKGEYKLIQRELPIESIELIEDELVKNVGLNKYVQSDTVSNPRKKVLDVDVEPEFSEDENIELDPEELEELDPDNSDSEEFKPIKIKILPDTPDIFDT